MSHLKAKSDFNLDAAKILIDDYGYYAPSVHCSYYGCFQFIKSKLNQIGITYDKMDKDISSSKQANTPTLSSHKYPINLMLREIEKKKDLFYKREVRNKIKDLKLFREESDYFNIEINHDKGKKALRLSSEIIQMIKSINL